MKYFSFFTGVVFLVCSISCDTNNEEEVSTLDFSLNTFPQQWKLVGVKAAMMPNAEIEADLNYNEFYKLSEDKSFQKVRIADGETVTGHGTFSINEEKKQLVFKFEESSGLISNCSNQKIEYLDFSEDRLINNSWALCDGPFLYFKRIE